MLWFLRLFRRFHDLERMCRSAREELELANARLRDRDRDVRELQSALEAETRHRTMAETMVQYHQSQAEQWLGEFKRMASERAAVVETVADFESMRLHGRQIFGRVPPAPPIEGRPQPVQPARVHPRTVVQQRERKFNADLMRQFYGDTSVAGNSVLSEDAPAAIND